MSYYGTSSRLTRIALEKVENDNYLNGLDRTQWYKIPNLNHLGDLKERFLELKEDAETTKFINDCFEKSEYFLTQLFHSVVMSVLKWVMAITSINGLLQRGSMFVFSEQQFSQLLDYPTSYGGVKLKSLLDLGAGDGAVTSRMAPFFENVYATEMSYTMQWRLQQKGFKVIDVNEWDKLIDTSPTSDDTAGNEPTFKSPQEYNNASIIDLEHSTEAVRYLKYDVITCLNLLDRCDKPITTLRKIKHALKRNGLLIVALVLPFKPYVEYNKNNRPDERLFEFYDFENRKTVTVAETYADKLDCVDDEMSCGVKSVKMGKIPSQIEYLLDNVFKPVGFELVRFSKLPYLCEGNLYQSFFFMFDYVFVFRST